MIHTLQDFIDASAFERSVLATVYPLVDAQAGRAGLDLRSDVGRIHVSPADNVGARSRDELVHELRPLLFGAAWKVLDLLVEFGLNQSTPTAHWTIQAKQAQAPGAQVVHLSSDPDVWPRVAFVYANTVEARHCLVHRRFVFSATGDMTQLVDRYGAAVPKLTVAAQNAFCRTAQRAAVVLQTGRFSARDRLDIIASLDQLTLFHGLCALGVGASARRPDLIQVNAQRGPAGWTVDIATARTTAEQILPGRPYYDVEITFPDTGIAPLVGRLEDAPRDSAVPIDPANPPAWIEP